MIKLALGRVLNLSVATPVERSQDRQVERTVSVLALPPQIAPAWVGGQRVIQVDRRRTQSGQPFEETMFYFYFI